MQEFCQQQLCLSTAVANTELSVAKTGCMCLLAAMGLRLHTVRNHLFQRETPRKGQETSWIWDTGFDIKPFVKKAGRHWNSRGCILQSKTVWESGEPSMGGLWDVTSHIFVVTSVPQVENLSRFFPLVFCLHGPSKPPAALYNIHKGIINCSVCTVVLRQIT